MKLGILGNGTAVREFLTTIDKLELEALAILGTEQTRAETEALAEKYSLTAYFDYDEMLRGDWDTIYVALPTVQHFLFGKKALEAGKNVILEKPGTSNYAEFVELAELAKAKDLILIEAVTTHYLPAYISLKEDREKLGNARIVRINYSRCSPNYKKFRTGEVVSELDPEQSGGALMNVNVYNLHFIVGLYGAPKSATYYANIERGIDVSGIMMLDYGMFKVACVGAEDCTAPQSIIQGDMGYVMLGSPVDQIDEYQLHTYNGIHKKRTFHERLHCMVYEFREFIRMIDEHDTVRATQMLEISATVARIMQESRRERGILFAADRSA